MAPFPAIRTYREGSTWCAKIMGAGDMMEAAHGFGDTCLAARGGK